MKKFVMTEMGDGKQHFCFFPFAAFAMKNKVLIEMIQFLLSISRKLFLHRLSQTKKAKSFASHNYLAPVTQKCLTTLHFIR